MRTIEYKGYVAEYEYDDEAELYCGSVVNTESYAIVIFELPEGYDGIAEAAGSRVRFTKESVGVTAHRPHPQPNLRRDSVRDIARFLESIGVKP